MTTLLPQLVQSYTTVNQNITANTTWTRGNTYYVSTAITVAGVAQRVNFTNPNDNPDGAVMKAKISLPPPPTRWSWPCSPAMKSSPALPS